MLRFKLCKKNLIKIIDSGTTKNLLATTKDLANTKTEVQSIKTNLQGKIKFFQIILTVWSNYNLMHLFTYVDLHTATSQGSIETKVKVGDLMTKLGGNIWIV
jgi:hypothetical protein